MSPLQSLTTGIGAGKRRSHVPPIPAANFPVQASRAADAIQLPHYPFQPLPKPNGLPPYRFDLSQLLTAADITKIKNAGVMVFHTVGDTGDYRDAGPQDLVAAIMTQDAQNSPDGTPARLLLPPWRRYLFCRRHRQVRRLFLRNVQRLSVLHRLHSRQS